MTPSSASIAGGNRLVVKQHTDGGWGWPLNAPPTYGNILGPIAMGLAQAYQQTGLVSQRTALINAGANLLAKTNNFSPSDGYLAAQLDKIFGGSTYRSHVIINFYNKLADSTYNRNGLGVLYNTRTYVNLIRNARSGSQANMAAWDIGTGLVGAAMCAANTTEWIVGTKAEINELDGSQYYDVLGLAGALYGLAFVGEEFDPTSGQHAAASNLSDLAAILASYQIAGGGFTWNSNYVIPNDGNETIQETGYAILALNQVSRATYLVSIHGAADYMMSVQLGTGGWEDYIGDGENNEVTGEALWGISAAYPPPVLNLTRGVYYPTIQGAISDASSGDTINVYPGIYDQDEANGYNPATGGSGSNNFNIFVNKSVTIQGVTANGQPITNAANVLAHVMAKRNKPEFGPDAIFVQADNVTITGLEISGWSGADNNKTIEATGDNLVLKYCKLNGLEGMPFYISDYNFNSLTNTSHVQSYRLESNLFNGTGVGRGVSISSGAGWTGNVNNRVITGNTFYNNNPGLAFVGPGGDGWDVYPVGAAIVTGNTFSQVQGRQVLAWGLYQSAQGYANLDWQSVVNTNTFDRGVIAWTPTNDARPFDVGNFKFVRGIYNTIQTTVDRAIAGDHVQVFAATYAEDVNLNKSLVLAGAGAATTIITGIPGGDVATVRINASAVTVEGFTITRQGNNLTDWNDPNLNSVGVAIIGTSLAGMTIHDNIIMGNRSGIDVNNSSGHTIRNNVITFNRTGLIFRNQTDNITMVENDITDNWTVGVLFLDASGGTNVPVQTALGCTITNNNISGNWYGQIVDRQSGGSLPAPGTTNLKNFSANWFGATVPSVSTANSAEPGYAAQIPVAYGGSAVPPGGQPDILGPASANFDFSPLLASGTDTDVETVPGRGTFGFQGDFSVLNVTTGGANTGSVGRIQEAINRVSGSTVVVPAGTFAEQLYINVPNLELLGAGATSTIIVPPASVMSQFFLPWRSERPIIGVDSLGTNVTIDGFTIDGNELGNTNVNMVGIQFFKGSGLVRNNHIKRIRQTPFGGGQGNVGILVNHDYPRTYSHAVEIYNNVVDDFGKAGIVCNHPGATGNIHHNRIIGQGPVGSGYAAQNGVQFGFGATGTAAYDTIASISYTGPSWAASGIVGQSSSGTLDITGNVITDVQVAVYLSQGASYPSGGTSASLTGNTITASAVGTGSAEFYGLVTYSLGGATPPDRPGGLRKTPVVSAYDDVPFGGSAHPLSMLAALTVTLQGNSFTSTSPGDGYAAYLIAADTSPQTVTADSNTISNYGYGIILDKDPGATLTSTWRKNSFVANQWAMYDLTGVLQDARENWWGSATGPADPKSLPAIPNYNNPAGLGDSVSSYIDYSPFYLDASLTNLSVYTLGAAVVGNGSVGKLPDQPTYNHATVVQLTATPDPGHHFTGWTGDVVSMTNPINIYMNANKSVTANFAINTYSITGTITEGVTPMANVTVDATGGFTGSVVTNGSGVYTITGVEHGTTGIVLTPSFPGYSFTPPTRTVNNVTGNVTTQDFAGTFNTYTITGTITDGVNPVANVTVTATGGYTNSVLTSVSGTYAMSVVPWGATGITLTPSLVGYTFDPESLTIAGPVEANVPDQNFTAIINTYTLTVMVVGSGSVARDPDQLLYNHGTSVELTATPSVGWAFTGWSGDVTGMVNPVMLVMTDDKIVTATFADTTAYRTFLPEDLVKIPSSVRLIAKGKRVPNGGNVRDSVFGKGAFPPTGLVVGVARPDSSTSFGWLRVPPRYIKQLARWYFRPTRQLMNTYYDFTGERSSHGGLRVYGNPLTQETATARANVGASDVGITTPGLGDLLFYDAGNPGHELNDMSIRHIMALADTALTMGWQRGYPQAYYDSLYSVLYRFNRAFVGPFVVTSNVPLRIAAAVHIGDVPFLKAPIGPVPPVTRYEPMAEEDADLPQEMELFPNYPNPFNPQTTISFRLSDPALVSLIVYNSLGQEVATVLSREEMAEGTQAVSFVASQLASGVYFYRIVAEGIEAGGKQVKTGKMLLVK
jgi:parallel beta-helix repeat protein